jgi:hypothetical protein
MADKSVVDVYPLHRNALPWPKSSRSAGYTFSQTALKSWVLDDLLRPYTIDLWISHMIDHEGLRDHIQRVGQEFYRRQDVETPHPA